MKGLLIKDFQLMKTQKTFLIVITAACVGLLVSGRSIAIVLTYVAAVFSMLAVSTVGYDEHDNGMSFLFTFPVSRKKYVLEKYTFGMLLLAAALAVGNGVAAVVSVARSQFYQPGDWYASFVGALMTAVLIFAVYMPVQLKFGSEKGRIVIFIALLVLLGIGYAVQKAAEVCQVDLSGIIDRLNNANVVQVSVFLAVLMALMLGISYLVSVAVMKKRQF